MSFSKTAFPRPNGKIGPSTPRSAKTGKRDLHDCFYQASLSSSPRFIPISVHRKETPVVSTKPHSLSKPRTPKLQCSPLQITSKKDWDQIPLGAVGTSPRVPTASKIEQCKGIVQSEAPTGIDSLQNLTGVLQLKHASSGLSSCEHISSQDKLSHGEDAAHLKIEVEAHSGHEGVTTEISICKEKNPSPRNLATCQRQQSSLAGMSHLPPNATATELEEYIYDLKQMLETERASNKDLRERLAETEGTLAEDKTHAMSFQDLLNTEKELRVATELRIPSTSSDTQDEQLNSPNRLTTSGELKSGNVGLSLKLNPWGDQQPSVAEIDDLRTSWAKKIELLAVPTTMREWKRNCENANVVLWVMGTAQLITFCTLCYIKWKR
ncbi:unnamed protein product [Allacma fusca]|uniref:Uncharacterized protein n=1 Tax=Allacma fusca TaxID=39272 RepID=A0A8J2KQF6_9HEXA|nr:unnamed protein product [Allacma fusca]